MKLISFSIFIDMSLAKCMVIFKQPFSYEEKTDRPIIGN